MRLFSIVGILSLFYAATAIEIEPDQEVEVEEAGIVPVPEEG